jgi:hypothetical protein
MIKLLSNIDVNLLLNEYSRVEKDIQWTNYGHKGKQSGLQYAMNEDPWSSAVGKGKGQEINYNNLNPFFKNTIFEEVINQHQLLRTRLMWVGPYACYSMHKDQTPRIHIPLMTNTECYFVFKHGLISHLSAGSVYCVDTTKFHTFMNCSDSHRLHLVGVIEK